MTATAAGPVTSTTPTAPAGPPTLRISVEGTPGRPDLVVPAASTPRELVGAGEPGAPALVLRTGVALDPDRALIVQGVRDGDLLVLVDAATAQAEPEQRSTRRRKAVSNEPHAGMVLLPCALVVAGVAAGTASAADALARTGVAAGIALAALLVVLLPRLGRMTAGAEALAPAFGAAAVVAVLPRTDPGADVLVIVAAGVVAAQVAAAARMVASPVAQAALAVWIWTGVVVAGVGAVVMAGDGPPRLAWALLALGAISAAKLLPDLVMDVPDEQLLDTERMATTTWSARTMVRGRRVEIDAADAVATVHAGRRLLEAGALVSSGVAAAMALALVLDPIDGWETWPANAAAILVGLALLLGSRNYRGLVPRLALRVGGLVALVAGAAGCLAASEAAGLYGIAAGTAIVGGGVLLGAIALGHGWRSVWWARLGDATELLCVAGVFPAAILAAGAFDHYRAMLS